MRCLIKRNAQSSLFLNLCLDLDLGYTIAVPLILLESPFVSTGEIGNKNRALNLFSVTNSEVSLHSLSFHEGFFPHSERRNEIAVSKAAQ